MTASIIKKTDGVLFTEATPYDELRAMLRPAFSDEELAEMGQEKLVDVARAFAWRLSDRRAARAFVEDHIAEGRLTQSQADAMSDDEKHAYQYADVVAGRLREELDGTAARRDARAHWHTKEPATLESVPTAPLLAVISDMVGVIAAQQAQIDELVYERDAFMANFAHRILERFERMSANLGRDYKGLRVALDLEDENSEKIERSSSEATEAEGKSSSARDTHVELKLLANQIGALGAGKAINVDEMNRKIARLTASSKSSVRARRKGKLVVEIGEVTSTKKDT